MQKNGGLNGLVKGCRQRRKSWDGDTQIQEAILGKGEIGTSSQWLFGSPELRGL